MNDPLAVRRVSLIQRREAALAAYGPVRPAFTFYTLCCPMAFPANLSLFSYPFQGIYQAAYEHARKVVAIQRHRRDLAVSAN